MKQLGVGMIGTGGIAGNHAPAVQALEESSLVAVLSRDKSTGLDFLKRHDATNAIVHTTLESFTADPSIDLVIICSPDRLHAEQATACLAARKHVLVEKPMTTSEKDALALVKLADASQLTLATGFHLRSHAGHLALHSRIVNENALGALRHIRVIWAFPQQDDSNWRAKQELTRWWSLSAVGAHCIDLVRWFANNSVDWKQFSPVISKDLWNGSHDETAVIAGQFLSGPTIEIVSSVQFGPYNRMELFGEKGHATCEGTFGREGAGEIRINNNPVPYEATNPFTSQLEDLISCIGTNKKPRADGSVGLRSVKDLILAYDS